MPRDLRIEFLAFSLSRFLALVQSRFFAFTFLLFPDPFPLDKDSTVASRATITHCPVSDKET